MGARLMFKLAAMDDIGAASKLARKSRTAIFRWRGYKYRVLWFPAGSMVRGSGGWIIDCRLSERDRKMPGDGELHGLTWNTAARSVQRRERLHGSIDWVSVMEKATSGNNVY